MPKQTPNPVNDQERMLHWQDAMPNFENWELRHGQDQHIQDYLQCYGIDQILAIPDIEYQAGFRVVNGQGLFFQSFNLTGDSRGRVLLVHGYTDHVGLFVKVITYLLNAGYSVCAFDFPGHGLSEGERATIESFDLYRFVLNDAFEFYQARFREPLHVVAQSLGGGMTLNWLLSNRSERHDLGKVVLFAPLVRPMAWKQANWSYRFLRLVVDSIPRGESKNSEDEAFSHFVRFDDPVQHSRLPAQWVGAMLEWVKTFEALVEENSGSELRFTMIQGDQDQTVDGPYNIEFLMTHFPKAILREVPDAGHHLAGESDRLQKEIFKYLEEGLS